MGNYKKYGFFVVYLQKYSLFGNIWNFTFLFVKIQFFFIVTEIFTLYKKLYFYK